VHKKLTETQLLLFFTNNKIFMTSILSLILAGLLKKNIENLQLFSFSMISNGIVKQIKKLQIIILPFTLLILLIK
jgi:hypothetical protein